MFGLDFKSPNLHFLNSAEFNPSFLPLLSTDAFRLDSVMKNSISHVRGRIVEALIKKNPRLCGNVEHEY